MFSNNLKCSESECKKRLKNVETMSLSELAYYADRCSTCGNWFLKNNKIADKTYQSISLKWAEKFNSNQIKSKK